MKQDKLEKFIHEHRAELDTDSPPPMVWMNLNTALDEQSNRKEDTVVRNLRSNSVMRIMQVAAMFVVVLGVGLIIGLQINKGADGYNNPRLQEFVEAERHYSKQIDKMWTTVKATGLENENTVEEDLKSLDNVYNELKNELLNGNGTNTNEVVNSMIDNYRTKIDILESVLNKTQQQNQQIQIEDDKVDI